ncbi:MAG: iron-containing alcohol dehydrogenase [Negativicutes bacterium]|nr:iron-containing alcohol dehydrogenase [Negativicutes bacterium]
MNEFVFRMPTRVLFGVEAEKNVLSICNSQKWSKIFVVTGKTSTKKSPHLNGIVESLKGSGIQVEVFSEVEADPSVETVDEGGAKLLAFGADAVLAFGGGSPMDAAKSMTLVAANGGSIADYLRGKRSIARKGVPLICLPTTAGTGSEVTAAAVTTDKHSKEKIGISHDFLMPMFAIIDPALHVSMPPAVTATTGIDALTHAIEAYVAVKANPVTDGLALQAITMIGKNLRRAYSSGDDLEARSNMALASLIAGGAFTNAGLGAVHAIAHPLGAQFGISHGMANGIMLPYVMEYCMVANYAKFRDIAAALGEDVYGQSEQAAAGKSVAAVNKLKAAIGIANKLAEVNVSRDALESIAKDAATYRLLPNSPRQLAIEDLRIIIANAL